MSELTRSHEKIIEWQKAGKSDGWIAEKLGFSREQYLDACAFIQRWREQETAKGAGR